MVPPILIIVPSATVRVPPTVALFVVNDPKSYVPDSILRLPETATLPSRVHVAEVLFITRLLKFDPPIAEEDEPLNVIVPPATYVPFLTQLRPTVCANPPSLNVQLVPIERFDPIVRIFPAVAESDPLPGERTSESRIIKGVVGNVFITNPPLLLKTSVP